MKVLIQTLAGDRHAAVVGSVLLAHNIDTAFSVGSDVPHSQLHSVEISNEAEAASVTRKGCELNIDDSYDLVWSRRVRGFQLPDLHPDDVTYAEREFRLFLDGFWQIASPGVVRLNPLKGRSIANSKLLPLAVARKCGFAISPTLASHDPSRIRAFVEEYGLRNVIFKPFGPMSWRDEHGAAYATPTTFLREDILEDDAAIRICPGIFQKFIPKEREFRVTVMGERVNAVALDPAADARTDWRINQSELKVSIERLPESVENACRSLVKELGLLFGCIDLILGRDRNWHFLEVNEMGQFLWVEDKCPETQYLQAFVEFIFELCERSNVPTGIELAPVLRSPEYQQVLASLGSVSSMV